MKVFDFNEPYILKNNVAYLRPMSEKDIQLLLPFSLKEPDLWKYSLRPANGIQNLTEYITRALQDKTTSDSYPFIVYDRRTNEVAGSTRFYDYQREHKTVQLGYTWYGKRYQGTGLNKHVKFLLLEFAFESIGLERVEFRADSNNARSIAAMKSIGCKVEGILRSNYEGAYGRRDSIVLSILKHEWKNSVKSILQHKLIKTI